MSNLHKVDKHKRVQNSRYIPPSNRSTAALTLPFVAVNAFIFDDSSVNPMSCNCESWLENLSAGVWLALAPVFKGSRNKQQRIQRELRKLMASGDYRLLHCQGGAVLLQRQAPDTVPGPLASSGSSNSCPWLE